MDLTVPDDIFEFFAADPVGPILSLTRVAEDPTASLFNQLNSFLDSIPSEMIAQVREDQHFLFLHEGRADMDRAARIWIAARFLSDEIPRRKLELLRLESRSARPTPYNTPGVTDVRVDSEHLVPLSEFQFDGSRLIRNGYAFTVLTTTGSPNSTYWVLNALYSEGIAERTSVRLDPFLFGPADTFPTLFYRMWMYGRPLDWNRISRLQQPEHGRWLPGTISHRSQFTDFSWSSRDNEVHFVCEEIPTLESVLYEPSRYLHAIYMPDAGSIGHLDGAIRLFTPEEIATRSALHVRNAGKLGWRQKIFRTDQPVPRETFSAVTQTFFVWNLDIQNYFTQALVSQ